MQNPVSGAGPSDDIRYDAWLLSNGRFSTLLSADGGGFSALDGFALTRWTPDPTRDGAGVHIYLRDTASGAVWTPAGGPVPLAGGHTFRCIAGIAEMRSRTDDIACAVSICVPQDHDVEIRRITLRNNGDSVRTIEVTTYAELSLTLPAADAAHPAFSRLFVQTNYDVPSEALLAWRRPRSPDDRPLWAAFRLLSDSGDGAAEYETDRARFIGRGRDVHCPVVVMSGSALSGTAGNVLDPVFSMRRTIRIDPGATAVLAAVLAGAPSRELALHALDAFPHVAATEHAFSSASAASGDALSALGMPQRWGELLRIRDDTAADISRSVNRTTNGTLYPADGAPAAVPNSAQAVAPATAPAAPDEDALWFFNGWGGFADDATSYVIRMPLVDGEHRRPPQPWVNVIANENAGCIVSESGAAYTWAANSRENRITPWFNDPVSDPHGEALYIRDEDALWSPTPGPAPGSGDYEVRHGFGFTQFLHESRGIAVDTRFFVPVNAPVRVARVALTNRSTRARRLTLCSYAQLVLGTHEAETRGRVATSRSDGGALTATNTERGEFSDRVAFAALVADDVRASSWTTDRRAFVGPRGSAAAPAALREDRLDGWLGAGRDPCFALSCTIMLEPGATAVCAFLLGEGASAESADVIVRHYATMHDVDAALAQVRAAWRLRVQAVQIDTPVPALDIMVNGWLVYQNLSCRMWARSAFYQSGGAFGFRDQLQDSSALLYVDPAITRDQILLHAAHQFVEGDVLHWWHPPAGKGIRTRFSDDLLWLPYITAFYIARTGDRSILDEVVPYITAPLLEPGEDETFLVPERSGESASLYEHCCRAIDRSLTRGAHGLPLMGVGDWNDGMNRVGREGRGESVWLGFFMYDILRDFVPICAAAGDDERVSAYNTYRTGLETALNDAGWDGEWYRRAFYDDGALLGSAQSDEGRIDALAQAWSVMSGAAPADRAAQALDAMEEHLVDEDAGLIRLLAPPFDRTPHDPGYIRGYLPGVRENGGQYTHGVLWAIRALAQHGRTERAARLLEMLSPVTRGGTPDNAARYQVEPYVIAADVYGVAPHVGRGGWTWYTGSAGWMHRIAIESILGIDMREGRELRVKPCIPAEWPGFNVTLRLPDGTVYAIGVSRGEPAIALDGAWREGISVPLLRDGRRHEVRVRIAN